MCAKTKVANAAKATTSKAKTKAKSFKDLLTTENTIALLADARKKYLYAKERRNIATSERVLSVASGAFMFYTGLTKILRSPITSLGEVVLGGGLILRGATGYCPVKEQITSTKDITIVELKTK